MSFTSPIFLLFLPSVLIFYWILPGKYRWILLLVASYLFYMYWNPAMVILLMISTAVDYGCGIGIENRKDEPKKKRLYLAISILINLLLLFCFKYLGFLGETVNALCQVLGIAYRVPELDLILPVGISFYTFQTMSYTFDVYQGKVKAERHLGHYALFVTFFPQLVAGPIERPADLLPQLKQTRQFNREDMTEGLCLLLRGYGKKVLIADYLAGFVDSAYASPSTAGGFALTVATVLFAVQIYCDFSGYTDIARGCARLMGIRLSENFRRPYAAQSIRDFWRRWHISLTGWFTDYLYIPLGGSRRGNARTYINILITFLASGLWHGANWTFVIWGGLHGIYLVTERLLWKKRKPGKALTFLAVCFAWIFFRSESLQDAFTVCGSIFSPWARGLLLSGLGATSGELAVAVILVTLLPFLEKLPKLSCSTNGQYRHLTNAAVIYFFLILAIVICRCLVLTQYGKTAFIYFQF